MRFFIYTLLGGLAAAVRSSRTAWCSNLPQAPTSPLCMRFACPVTRRSGCSGRSSWPLRSSCRSSPSTAGSRTPTPWPRCKAPWCCGGVMLKMGLFGIIVFVFPIVPVGVEYWRDTVIWLSAGRCALRGDHRLPAKRPETTGRVLLAQSRRHPVRGPFRVEQLRHQRFALSGVRARGAGGLPAVHRWSGASARRHHGSCGDGRHEAPGTATCRALLPGDW